MSEDSEVKVSPKKILIVEDDKDLAQLLQKFFVKAGHAAEYATKGKEALEIYNELTPDLVLLDVLLPGMMGFEVMKRMKEKSWSDKVKFIVMSGVMKDPETVQKAHDFGAEAFLEKPFQVREMHNAILKCLGLDTIEDAKKKEKEEQKAEASKTEGPVKAPVIPEPEVTIEGGDLAQADLPRILAAFFTAKVSGVLKVNYGEMVKAIYFEDGKPIFAASSHEQDRLGHIIVRSKMLTEEQVQGALQRCGEHTRLGATLIDMKLLGSKDLFSLIQQQVREIILSLFSWTGGRYAFVFENLAEREMIKLQTSPADLVLSGIREFYNESRLMKQMVSYDRILQKSDNKHFAEQTLNLDADGRKIMGLIDGNKSIEKIIEDSEVDTELALKIIYALIVMKVVTDKPS